MSEVLIEQWLEIMKASTPEIKPHESALLIIDMQEYQVSKDWPLFKLIDESVPGILDYFVNQVSKVVEPNIKKLEFFLQNMGVEQLFVVGVVTNICVEGSARTTSELGFDVFIIEDACAAWSPEIHKNTLVSFELMFGSIITTDEAIKKINENLLEGNS